MSGEDENLLKNVLESLKLQKYYVNFQKEEILYSDLEHFSEDDLREFIPSKFHLKRLLVYMNKEKEKTKESADNPSGKKSDEEMVQMFVKCDQEVENVYDVPLNSTNKELIGRLLHAFLGAKSRVKLQGEEIEIASGMKSFTLRKWFEKNERSPEDTIRAVLTMKRPSGKGVVGIEEVERLKKELENVKGELENKIKILLKRAERAEKEKENVRRELETLSKKYEEDEEKEDAGGPKGMKIPPFEDYPHLKGKRKKHHLIVPKKTVQPSSGSQGSQNQQNKKKGHCGSTTDTSNNNSSRELEPKSRPWINSVITTPSSFIG